MRERTILDVDLLTIGWKERQILRLVKAYEIICKLVRSKANAPYNLTIKPMIFAANWKALITSSFYLTYVGEKDRIK